MNFNFRIEALILCLIICISIVSSAVIDRSSLRVKRQWGGWNQQNYNNFNQYGNQENIRARNRNYNCQTEGIDFAGIPISEYECQNSGSSTQINAQQSGFNQNSQNMFQQGGIVGELIRDFGKRK